MPKRMRTKTQYAWCGMQTLANSEKKIKEMTQRMQEQHTQVSL